MTPELRARQIHRRRGLGGSESQAVSWDPGPSQTALALDRWTYREHPSLSTHPPRALPTPSFISSNRAASIFTAHTLPTSLNVNPTFEVLASLHLGPSTRVGHGRSMSGVVYQRKGARPAASTTPPTAVHEYGSSSHLMYLNSSDANSIGNGYFQVFWPSRWRHVRTPSTGTTTQTKGVNDLWASE